MTHRHDIDELTRLKLSKENGRVGAISPPWLRDVIRNRYPDAHTNGNLHTLPVYHPTALTDEVEAAIFAAAWKLNGWLLRKKFGDQDTVSLFQRFAPYGLIKREHPADHMITVHRGTTDENFKQETAPLSWTTSRKVARLFAINCREGKPLVVSGTVSVSDVLMRLKSDRENEIVVVPGTVFVQQTVHPRRNT